MVPVMREPHTNLTERRMHTHAVRRLGMPVLYQLCGVFSMIDEEMRIPKGSDEAYLSKVPGSSTTTTRPAGRPACPDSLSPESSPLPCPALFVSSQLKSRYGRHAAYVAPRVDSSSSGSFGVRHYAGPVVYDVAGFIEKNRDTLSADVMQALQVGTNHDHQAAPPASDTGGGGTPVDRRQSARQTLPLTARMP